MCRIISYLLPSQHLHVAGIPTSKQCVLASVYHCWVYCFEKCALAIELFPNFLALLAIISSSINSTFPLVLVCLKVLLLPLVYLAPSCLQLICKGVSFVPPWSGDSEGRFDDAVFLQNLLPMRDLLVHPPLHLLLLESSIAVSSPFASQLASDAILGCS